MIYCDIFAEVAKIAPYQWYYQASNPPFPESACQSSVTKTVQWKGNC